MLDFRPPLDWPFLLWWSKINFPLYMKLTLGDTTIKIEKGALNRFKKLKGQRAMVCPNHSNRHDPQVMFSFSREAEEYFNFVAAREVFDFDHGMNGWWLQHAGCYSVVRGAADRESFKTTRRILVEGKKKLVLFPEGEISRQNDTLMTLESGAAQLSFWALSDLEKGLAEKGQKIAPATLPTVQEDGTVGDGGPIVASPTIFIQPMAFKYTYPYDISSSLRETLKTLEAKLGLKAGPEDTFQGRLIALCERLLTALQKEYEFKCPADATMNERVKALRVHILHTLAARLNVELPAGGKELENVRILRNKIDDYIYQDEKKKGSAYEQEAHEEKQRIYRGYYKDLNRVVNFISIYQGYVSEHMTQERFSDVIERLEVEILGGEPSIKGPRQVQIDVGEAIDLSLYAEGYKTHKKETIAKVTEMIAAQISTMLVKMEAKRTPIYLD
ncbi:MAG: 1-acyl-sn-glycerol-3-phosphate acyltransferase [Cyanobacteria bacterium REEB67]|nr:1-acyl-sn-glycerol-3-phosphate acyltransferase [Cyanobacteria bacterium REEB67]